MVKRFGSTNAEGDSDRGPIPDPIILIIGLQNNPVGPVFYLICMCRRIFETRVGIEVRCYVGGVLNTYFSAIGLL